MENRMIYNVESIKTLRKNIDKKGNEMIKILTKILKETQKMDEIYTTPTGQIFKEKLIGFIQNRITFIKDNYLSLNEIVDVAINEYSKHEEAAKKMVGGK